MGWFHNFSRSRLNNDYSGEVYLIQHYVIKFINDLRFFRSHKSSRHISVNGRNWESCFITNLILVLLFCGGDVVLFSEMFEDTKVVIRRYQSGNQKHYIEERQTLQWPKENKRQ